jgi:hypothetical protein
MEWRVSHGGSEPRPHVPLRVRAMLPSPTPRLQFREMTAGDLAGIATLEIGGSRGPEGWIEWTSATMSSTASASG